MLATLLMMGVNSRLERRFCRLLDCRRRGGRKLQEPGSADEQCLLRLCEEMRAVDAFSTRATETASGGARHQGA